MKQSFSLLIIAVAIGSFACSPPEPVKPKKVPKEFTEHGNKRVDEYFWMNDRKDSAVIAHLNAENAYTEAMMAPTRDLQSKIYDELVARVEQRYESLPVKRNGYWYYTRYEEGKQYPLYCRKKGSWEAREEVLLNVPEMAKGYQIYIVRGYSVSRDNRWLAYGIDTTGDRRCTLRFKDLTSGTTSTDILTNTSGQYVWANDNATVVYVVNDHTVRPYRAMRHTLGIDPASDGLVYVEKDSTRMVQISSTRDNKYIFLTMSDTEEREGRYLLADKPEMPPILVQPMQSGLVYSLEEYEGDSFIILTNKNAENFRLVRAPIRKPSAINWSDIIPHRSDALLQSALVLKDFIVAQQRIEGLTQILITDRKSRTTHYVDFGEQAYVAYMYPATDDYDLDSIRYAYMSLTTPRTDYLYRLDTRQRERMKKEYVGGGFVDSLYETRRVWATANDGVRVPLSVVYRTSLLKKDGSNPMLLYAYGSYGASMDPYFDRSVISLLDRGFVYGIAHIRGGQEMGRRWYEDGKMLKKKNTFTDFIACAEYMIAEKYTSADRLFANGGSAGGMLMGAITNLRPDLFRGVLAEVPWMDVITDMLNPDLPLTTQEYGEWGNPNFKDQYNYMLGWSPYDNVRDANYPAILATGGLNDTQVPYFSPAKWVARVRDHNKGKNPVLFKVNMGAGHGGESGRFERLRLTALKYSFMIDQVGLKK